MNEMGKAPVGYQDTPFLPQSTWRVHDAERPQPLKIEIENDSSLPTDAIMLFDGTNLSEWISSSGGNAGWRLSEDFMEVVPKSGSIQTVKHFSK